MVNHFQHLFQRNFHLYSTPTPGTTYMPHPQKNKYGCFQNSGIPKWSILIGFSIINHPFWGTPIFGNTQIKNTTPWKVLGTKCCTWLQSFNKTWRSSEISPSPDWMKGAVGEDMRVAWGKFYERLFVCLFACLIVCLFVCLLACLFVCLLACLFVCLLVCLLVCLFVCLLFDLIANLDTKLHQKPFGFCGDRFNIPMKL